MVDLVILSPGGQHGIYGDLALNLTSLEPPPWARMIAGYIRDRGFSVAIIDAEALDVTELAIAAQAINHKPKLVAIVVAGHQPSASTQAMTSAGKLASLIKAFDPDQKIIMTGNHVSALPIRTLQEESIDYVCDGEGPITILGLLTSPTTYSIIPGLVWKYEKTNVIVRNNPAPLIEDLDKDLHGNVWDSFTNG